MRVSGGRTDYEHFPRRPHNQPPACLTHVRLVPGQKRASELKIDAGTGACAHGPGALITDGLLRAVIVQGDQAPSPLLGLVLPLQVDEVMDNLMDDLSRKIVHRVRSYGRCFV